MVKEILTASGLQHRRGSSPKRLPDSTVVYYFDDVELDAPDRVTPSTAAGLPCICHHDVRLEVYEPQADPAAEAALEAQIRARGLTFKKYDREWLQSVQRYLVNYEISYTTKT